MSDEQTTSTQQDLIYPTECYAILGACFAVYQEKGCGFLEAVYQECLEMELEARGIPFAAQTELRLEYRGRPLRQVYIADLVCYGKIIVELKAITKLAPEHHAQLMNYLKATNFMLGLLVNFGHYPKIEYARIVCERGRYTRT